MCDPLVLVLPTGQMCIDDLANGCSHHYQSTKASTGLLIIIHTSSPQLSLSPSPIWSACPITNHSDFHQNFSQCSQLFQVCLRISYALDFSCAGCLQWAPSSSVHSPQMSHKSTLRMRTNPCQVYSTNLILSVHPPQIHPQPVLLNLHKLWGHRFPTPTYPCSASRNCWGFQMMFILKREKLFGFLIHLKTESITF